MKSRTSCWCRKWSRQLFTATDEPFRCRRRRALPSDQELVRRILIDCARPLLGDHTGRILYTSLRRDKQLAVSTELKAPRLDPFVATREDWLAAVLDEAARMQADCRAVSGLPFLDPADPRARRTTPGSNRRSGIP